MENPSFFLEGILKDKNDMQDFEGPLSLILMLLSKNKIEIKDIKIADILEQYLEYLEKMQSMDLEIASEFVQMASHLLYIKTKTLLVVDDEEVSELELLIASLEQLKAKDVLSNLQQVTPELKTASELGMLYFTKMPEPIQKSKREYEYKHQPIDLLKAMYGIYTRGVKVQLEDNVSSAIPKRIIYSVKDKSRQLVELLQYGKLALNELYKRCASRSEVVATFMSILELCSMGGICIERIEDGFEVGLTSDNIDDIIDKIVE